MTSISANPTKLIRFSSLRWANLTKLSGCRFGMDMTMKSSNSKTILVYLQTENVINPRPPPHHSPCTPNHPPRNRSKK